MILTSTPTSRLCARLDNEKSLLLALLQSRLVHGPFRNHSKHLFNAHNLCIKRRSSCLCSLRSPETRAEQSRAPHPASLDSRQACCSSLCRTSCALSLVAPSYHSAMPTVRHCRRRASSARCERRPHPTCARSPSVQPVQHCPRPRWQHVLVVGERHSAYRARRVGRHRQRRTRP